jgi:hypothetical protein
MFVLPFFDTQLFLDDCFSFSRHNKKKKRKLSFWDDAYAAGVWTIDEPMEKKFKRSFWYDYVRYGMRSFMLYIVAAAPLDGIAGGL